MKKTLVCVYGTLKKNGGNDYLLASSKMISEGLLLDHKLFFSGRGGGFPVAMKDEGSRSLCEVYEVDEPTVKNLDCLEGYNADKDRGMYLRRTSKVLCQDGEVRECSYYLGSDDFWDFDEMTPCPINNKVSVWS